MISVKKPAGWPLAHLPRESKDPQQTAAELPPSLVMARAHLQGRRGAGSSCLLRRAAEEPLDSPRLPAHAAVVLLLSATKSLPDGCVQSILKSL